MHYRFLRASDRLTHKSKNQRKIVGPYEDRTRDLGVNKLILAPRSNQLI